jgi:hypothetical protein
LKSTAARFLSLSTAALPMLAPVLPAQAQAWPVKPVRVVVPAGAGGAADILARILAEPMGAVFSTSFIVDNRPGAGGVIGSEIVACAPGDGYTLVVSSNTLIIAPSLYKVSYDVQRDFTAIGSIASAPNLPVASPELKVKTLAELIALARRASGGLACGSPTVGSAAYLTVELLARACIDPIGTGCAHQPAVECRDQVPGNAGAARVARFRPGRGHTGAVQRPAPARGADVRPGGPRQRHQGQLTPSAARSRSIQPFPAADGCSAGHPTFRMEPQRAPRPAPFPLEEYPCRTSSVE